MKRAREKVRVRARARGSGFPMAILKEGAADGKKGEHPGLGAASPRWVRITLCSPESRAKAARSGRALGELWLSAWNISVVFRGQDWGVPMVPAFFDEPRSPCASV